MADIYSRTADSHPHLRRGKVWCRKCRREQAINSADGIRNGWPRCCGYTMTIDHLDMWRQADD